MGENMASNAGTVKIGDLKVNRIGLGTNRIIDNDESRDLLKAAVDLGISFIDTAHRYTDGVSETIIGNTLSPYPDGVVIATKGGLTADGPQGSPKALRRHLEDSLLRLKTDCIDLYQLHRIDPSVPMEDSIGALKQFKEEGKIRFIGLSEVSVDELTKAQAIVSIASVQNEFNVLEKKSDDLVDYCTEHGIVFIPWFPLGGLRGGAEKVNDLLKPFAQEYGVLSQQIALAWLLKRSLVMLPIPGTLSIDHLKSNLRASEIDLSEEDFVTISKLA
jgi:pyridoxine 4-dehydrogenase